MEVARSSFYDASSDLMGDTALGGEGSPERS